MTVFSKFFDGLQNLVANLGTTRDKSYHSEYTLSLLTMDQILSAYRGSWLPRKIVRIPAQDAVRKWRNWSAESTDVSAIEELETTLAIRSKVLRGLTLARLTGGAALLIGADVDRPEEPIRLERLGKDSLKYVAVLSKGYVSPETYDRDVMSETFGRPSHYNVTSGAHGGVTRVHASRLVLLYGDEPLDESVDGHDGWGDPVLQSVYQSLLQHDASTANIASLVFESKIDVINIPGMMANIGSAGYEAKLLRRFGAAAMMKGNNGTLILDEKETHSQKNTSFAGLSDVLDRFAQNVSGAADIPMTRLFGRAPAGMNSTGESDMRNYYDAIQADQELTLTPALSVLDECLIRSSLGSRPDEVYYDWRSLWQTTQKERADIGDISAKMIKTLAESKLFPDETLAEAARVTLSETGAMPGLDAAIEQFGMDREEDDVPPEDLAGAVPGDPGTEAPGETPSKDDPSITDATPRTLYVRRDVVNRAEIARWAKSQGVDGLLDDLHVTIAYSRTPVDWMVVGESWEDQIEIRRGGPRIVERLGADGEYLALVFASSSLTWRHREIIERGATWDWPDYQPHVSISVTSSANPISIEPYTGRIVLGPEIFEEVRGE